MGPVSQHGVYDFRKLKNADHSAQQRAQSLDPGKLVLACGRVVEQQPGKTPKAPKAQRHSWRLRVVVVADGGGWPVGLIPVDITQAGAPYGSHTVSFHGTVQSNDTQWVDNGLKLLRARVPAAAGWSQSSQTVSLDDGDDKLVILRVMREPWVAFRVFHLKLDDYYPGLQWQLQIPGLAGVQTPNSLQLTPNLFESLPANAVDADIQGIGTQDNTEVFVAVALRHES
jgi:hypothetical protein